MNWSEGAVTAPFFGGGIGLVVVVWRLCGMYGCVWDGSGWPSKVAAVFRERGWGWMAVCSYLIHLCCGGVGRGVRAFGEGVDVVFGGGGRDVLRD